MGDDLDMGVTDASPGIKVLGPGPDGNGVVVQADDGSQHLVMGNKITPLPNAPLATPPLQPLQNQPVNAPPVKVPLSDAPMDWGGAARAFFGGAEQGSGKNFGVLDPTKTDAAMGEHPNFGAAGQALGKASAFAHHLLDPVTQSQDLVNGAQAITPDFIPGGRAKETINSLTSSAPGQAVPAGAATPAVQAIDPKGLVTAGEVPAAPAPVSKGKGGASSKPMAPDATDQAFSDEAVAAGKEGEAKAAQSKALGEAQTQAVKDIGDMRQKYLDAADEARKTNMTQWQKVNDEIDQVGKLQVDPDRWWKSRTQGQKVLGTIAMALSGFSEGMGAGKGGADMIENAIGRDVKAQEFNIDNRRSAASQHQTALTHFYEITNSKPAAIAAANAWGLKQADMKIEALKSTMQAPVDIAHANQVQAEIRQKAGEWKLKSAQIQTEMHGQQLDQRLKQMQIDALNKAQQAGPNRNLQDGEVKVGDKIYNVGKESFKDIRQTQAQGDEVREALAVMKEEARKFGVSSDKTGPGSRYAAAKDVLIGALNSSEGIKNAVSKQQGIRLDKFSDPSIFKSADALIAGLNTMDSAVRRHVNHIHHQVNLPDYYGPEPTPEQQDALAKAGRK